jgi:hypothetical protein
MEGHLLANIEVVGPSLVRFPRRVGERVHRARSARNRATRWRDGWCSAPSHTRRSSAEEPRPTW